MAFGRAGAALSAALLALAFATPGGAVTFSKLDPLARIALSQAQAGSASAKSRKHLGRDLQSEGRLDLFVVGHLSEADLTAMGATVRTAIEGQPSIFTIYATPEVVQTILADPMVQAIRGAAPAEPELDASVPTTNAPALRGPGPAFGGLDGTGVLIADVDSGVDYDHGDFLDPAGLTRFVGLWDQTDPLGPSPSMTGTGPYEYGSDWSPADLDAHLAREADSTGHGTHVMGIAGGDGSATGGPVPPFTYVGMAPKADLLMVKTTFATTDILDGVAFAFGRGAALGRPTVVNLSLGSHFGPHDGTSAFEAGLSALSGPGRVIVKSAGNERTQLRHAQINASGPGTSVTMLVAGSGPGRTIAIDGYYEATELIDVQITTPRGIEIGQRALGGSTAPFPGAATADGYVYLENGVSLTSTGDREVYIEINCGPGQDMNGTWTFTFIPVALGLANGEVDLWRFFSTLGTLATFVAGNQPDELISEPGNAREVITAAAWTTRRYWTDCAGNVLNFAGAVDPPGLAPFSSPGPTRDGRPKPEIAAPGSAVASATSFDTSPSCPGVGSPSVLLADGLQHSMNQGTSMAAPHVAGAVAILMQRYGNVTPTFARHQLEAHALSDVSTGPVWNQDWGHGRLYLGTPSDPRVTVLSPNGGETVYVGQWTDVQWSADDADGVASVDVRLSRDGGTTYELVASGLPDTGSYTWTVSEPPTTQALLSVVAHDSLGNLEADLSDQAFTIESPVTSVPSLFRAERDGEVVAVSWEFPDPASILTATLERADRESGPFAPVRAELSISGTLTIALDREVEAGRAYFYRLVAVTRDGQRQTFGPVRTEAASGVGAFALSRAFPNPSGGATTVEFAVPRRTELRLSVLDVQGREVAVLAEGRYAPGRYPVTWGGEIAGGPAPAGLYFIRYAPKGEQGLVRRVVLAR